MRWVGGAEMRYRQHPKPCVGNSQMEREPQLQGFSPRSEASSPGWDSPTQGLCRRELEGCRKQTPKGHLQTLTYSQVPALRW